MIQDILKYEKKINNYLKKYNLLYLIFELNLLYFHFYVHKIYKIIEKKMELNLILKQK